VTRLVIARDRSVFDDVGQRMLDEGMRELPGVWGDSTVEMLPQKRHRGRCRLCGNDEMLTREHIPPGAALNLGRSRVHTIEEWIRRQGDDLPGGVLRQGGNWSFTLCKPCNDRTGARYGDEYKRWADVILNMLAEAKTNVRELDAELQPRGGTMTLDGGDGRPSPRPGAFVRQVLSMFCSLSGGYDLAGKFPAIRRIVLDGAVEPLPAGMSIGMTIYLNTRSRVVGPMWVGDTRRGTWRWLMEVAHAPIATLLVLKSNREDDGPAHICDISNFTQIGPNAHARVDGDIQITTAYQPEVGDYRTRAQVEAEARETVLVPREGL